MTITVTHAFVSAVADDPTAPQEVRPSDWNATHVVNGGNLTITDGSHTVADVTQITVNGGTIGGSTPDATLTITGGGVSLPLPFFGNSNPPWVRPSLNIGGPSSAFNTWLNQGGQVINVGIVSFSNNGTGPSIAAGQHYAPSDTVTIAGGTGTAAVLRITDTQLVSAAIVNGGSSGTPGAAQVIGTTGVGPQLFVLDVIIGAGGNITSIVDINNAGDYTTNPSNLSHEPVADNSSSGITGAVVSVVMGALAALPTSPGNYTVNPTNPASQSSSSGSGTGATWDLSIIDLASAADGSSGTPLIIEADTVLGGSVGFFTLSGVMTPIGVSAPWTVTVAISAVPLQNGFCTIFLFDSSSNIAAAFDVTYLKVITNANDPATATVSAIASQYNALSWQWMKIQNDGTNLIFSFSDDNISFLTGVTKSLTFFGASFNFVGLGILRNADTIPIAKAKIALWNFTQTSP
jgi:hypothetical protein